jgi:hypothetical protein
MTAERFRAIVDAYGADPARWPADERGAAQAWAAQHRAAADALLDGAAQLDAWLGEASVAAPAAALTRRIAASAPQPAPPRARLWWSGAAFVGAGLAGCAAGAFAMSVALLAGSAPAPSVAPPDAASLTTSFGGMPADWSGE